MASHPRNSTVLFVGTYTEPEGSQSEGMYIYRIDPTSGQLMFDSVVQGIINPSFLAVHPGQNFLYAVNEVQNFNSQAGGGVSAFSINESSGELTLLNEQFSHGADPCYINIEQTGRFAMVANYSSGSVAMFPINPDGSLGAASDVVQHSGSSFHPERQTKAHAHCILPDQINRFAIAVDLGLDKLIIYQMDVEHGKLHLHHEVNVHPGAGPRHLTFHPNGQYVYLINELDATICVYRYHADDGTFEGLQTTSALPKDFEGENLCADIHVSPNGRFLYGSNRGHDSIVCFLIDENTGILTYIGHMLTGGREPRNFVIDPSGNFLLVANQKTDTISTFRIDLVTGRLFETGHQAEVSMPVCLKFAYLKS